MFKNRIDLKNATFLLFANSILLQYLAQKQALYSLHNKEQILLVSNIFITYKNKKASKRGFMMYLQFFKNSMH